MLWAKSSAQGSCPPPAWPYRYCSRLVSKSFGGLGLFVLFGLPKGVPYKLLTFFYIIGMLPLLLRFDISFITRFTTANSLLAKLMVCVALFALAAKYGDILQRPTLEATYLLWMDWRGLGLPSRELERINHQEALERMKTAYKKYVK